MLGMLISPNLVKGRLYRPMVVDVGGARQGGSELLQAVYANPLGICCGFAAVLNILIIPILGKGCP